MLEFNRETLDWLFWKTKLKTSLRPAGTLDIIKVPSYQAIPEYNDDKSARIASWKAPVPKVMLIA